MGEKCGLNSNIYVRISFSFFTDCSFSVLTLRFAKNKQKTCGHKKTTSQKEFIRTRSIQ